MTVATRVVQRVGDCLQWLTQQVRSVPGTSVLFLIVAVTTFVLRGVDAETVDRILRESSTNLVHMSRDAPRVLMLSMFLLGGGSLWRAFWFFALILAPVERWLGTYRWAAVFAAGHVGATLATTIAIWTQARAGVGGRELSYVVDVGVSYGIAAAAGVLVFRLPRLLSILAAALFLSYVLAAVARTGTFTDWGHLVALLIGFALGPLVRPARPSTVRTPPRVPGWLQWAATPPTVSPVQRRRAGRIGGGVLVALAVSLLVVSVAVDTDVDLPGAPGVVAATIVGDPVRCGPSCTSVDVRWGRGAVAHTAHLILPPGTEASRGTGVSVRRVPGVADEVRLAAVARRVDVRGLLGEAAVLAAGVGIGLLLTVGRGQTTAVPA
jgi:hypothetical protein